MTSPNNTDKLEEAVNVIDELDLSTVKLGVLLNYRLLKWFLDDGGRDALYRGRVVSYLVPPTHVSGERTIEIRTTDSLLKPLDHGLYHIEFDDGDRCDMDPQETFRWVMLYNDQRRKKPKNRLPIVKNPNSRERNMLQEKNSVLFVQQKEVLELEYLLYYRCFSGHLAESGHGSPTEWASSIQCKFRHILSSGLFKRARKKRMSRARNETETEENDIRVSKKLLKEVQQHEPNNDNASKNLSSAAQTIPRLQLKQMDRDASIYDATPETGSLPHQPAMKKRQQESDGNDASESVVSEFQPWRETQLNGRLLYLPSIEGASEAKSLAAQRATQTAPEDEVTQVQQYESDNVDAFETVNPDAFKTTSKAAQPWAAHSTTQNKLNQVQHQDSNNRVACETSAALPEAVAISVPKTTNRQGQHRQQIQSEFDMKNSNETETSADDSMDERVSLGSEASAHHQSQQEANIFSKESWNIMLAADGPFHVNIETNLPEQCYMDDSRSVLVAPPPDVKKDRNKTSTAKCLYLMQKVADEEDSVHAIPAPKTDELVAEDGSIRKEKGEPANQLHTNENAQNIENSVQPMFPPDASTKETMPATCQRQLESVGEAAEFARNPGQITTETRASCKRSDVESEVGQILLRERPKQDANSSQSDGSTSKGNGCSSCKQGGNRKESEVCNGRSNDLQKSTKRKRPRRTDGEKTSPLSAELPRSSQDWICPLSVTTDQVDRKLSDCFSTIVGAFSKDTSTHPLPKRFLTVPCECDNLADKATSEHQLVLTVETSYIPNAGRGLFVTYRGPCQTWHAPGYIDLGKYAPHGPEDIKSQVRMEVKNFLFEDKPSEWSFQGPPSRDGQEACILHGKKVDENVIYDITSDETGLVHEMATNVLLPFVNETDKPAISRKRRKRRGRSCKQRLVQNVDAVYHDDGSVHYLLREGSELRKGEKTELLVYYGNEYDGVRHRKYSNYGNEHTLGSVDSIVVTEGGTRDADGNEELSTLSGELAGESDGSPEISGCIDDVFGEARQIMTTHYCRQCRRCDRLPSKMPKAGMCYRAMYATIASYTESDVRNVLNFFLESPPTPSLARRRMIWAVRHLSSYANQLCCQNLDARVASDITETVLKVLQLFPRGPESLYHHQDWAVDHAQRLLGLFIRQEIRDFGFCCGVVEEIVSPPTLASSLGRVPVSRDSQSIRFHKNLQYRVSFSQLEEDRTLSEREICDHLIKTREFLLIV